MRDLEFLPPWYARLLRQRRAASLQVWGTLLMAAALAGWLFLANRNVRRVEASLGQLQRQAAQTENDLRQMDRLEELRKLWRQRAEAMEKLGMHVESLRLVERVAEAMPEGVALLTFTADTEESAVQLTAAQRAALKEAGSAAMDRRLRARVLGVAPTDVELATFLTELNKVPFFEQIAPTFARDRREGGHLLREFEVTFSVNLNWPGGK